uniref:Uncharacterized protein n=1 Tax=Arundo donax TaxID=35708 RepID=A0A0A9G8G7_ARUDO
MSCSMFRFSYHYPAEIPRCRYHCSNYTFYSFSFSAFIKSSGWDQTK